MYLPVIMELSGLLSFKRMTIEIDMPAAFYGLFLR